MLQLVEIAFHYYAELEIRAIWTQLTSKVVQVSASEA